MSGKTCSFAVVALAWLAGGCDRDVWTIGGCPGYEAALRAQIQARAAARERGLVPPPFQWDEAGGSSRKARTYIAVPPADPPPLMTTAVADAASRCGLTVADYLALKNWTPTGSSQPPGAAVGARPWPATIPNPVEYFASRYFVPPIRRPSSAAGDYGSVYVPREPARHGIHDGGYRGVHDGRRRLHGDGYRGGRHGPDRRPTDAPADRPPRVRRPAGAGGHGPGGRPGRPG